MCAVVLAGYSSLLPADPATQDLANLGRALFFDGRLSVGRNQSCSSCHDPVRAFSDARGNKFAGAVSVGGDEVSLGDRNAPALTYVSLMPEFRADGDGEFVGGFFRDGRAATMIEQAQEPILNVAEMALPDVAAVLARLRENSAYVTAFRKLLGPDSLASPERALVSVATAISAYENTTEFSSFDSKYDRYLRGETELTREEELGRILFFSELINCNRCHLADRRENTQAELFTNHRYHNIGIPPNRRVRAANGLGESHVDRGLLQNPAVRDPAQAGRFRVPSLRNVAVTAPYMHNGVFMELETAILFYNRFLLADAASQINPETGHPWDQPEVARTVDSDLLQDGQPLTRERVAWLVAFLKTLTDQRYEHLLGH